MTIKSIVAGDSGCGKTFFIRDVIIPQLIRDNKKFFVYDLVDEYKNIAPSDKHVVTDEMRKARNKKALIKEVKDIAKDCEQSGKYLILDNAQYFLNYLTYVQLFHECSDLNFIATFDNYKIFTYFIRHTDTVYYMGLKDEQTNPDFYITRAFFPHKFVDIENWHDHQIKHAK
jgi:hypothetical protein